MRSPHYRHWLAFLCSLGITLIHAGAQVASLDDNWDSQFGVPGSDGVVYSILVSGNEIYVGGNFTQIGGVSATNIAKFDGSNWSSLGQGLTGGIFPAVLSLAIWNGDLYAGGSFVYADGRPVNRVARWDGQSWSSLGMGVTGVGIVRALAVSESKLVVGGSFSSAGEISTLNIAQWDGTNWSALGAGITWPYSGAAVDCLAVGGSDLYAGGRFRSAGGTPATNVAKWNGATWSPLGAGLRYFDGSGPENGAVSALTFCKGLLFATGEFTKAGGIDAGRIAGWNGTNWFSLGDGFRSGRTLVSNGPDLFVGGDFLSADGVPANNIALWRDGVWLALGSGVEGGPEGGAVWSMATSGTELYVGGPFGLAGGKPSSYIARYHIPHALTIQRTANEVTLSWPATGTNFLLEAGSELASSDWWPVAPAPVLANNQCVVTNALSPTDQFYRLRRK